VGRTDQALDFESLIAARAKKPPNEMGKVRIIVHRENLVQKAR
jgi:hypothetical protein